MDILNQCNVLNPHFTLFTQFPSKKVTLLQEFCLQTNLTLKSKALILYLPTISYSIIIILKSVFQSPLLHFSLFVPLNTETHYNDSIICHPLISSLVLLQNQGLVSTASKSFDLLMVNSVAPTGVVPKCRAKNSPEHFPRWPPNQQQKSKLSNGFQVSLQGLEHVLYMQEAWVLFQHHMVLVIIHQVPNH